MDRMRSNVFVELHDYEPVAVRNKTEDEWAEEDINRCVLDGWPECNPKWGEKVDMQLVRGIIKLYKII